MREGSSPAGKPHVDGRRALQVAALLHAAIAAAVPIVFPRAAMLAVILFFLWPLWLYPLSKSRSGGSGLFAMAWLLVLVILLLGLLTLLMFVLGART